MRYFETNSWEWEIYAKNNGNGIQVVNFGPKICHKPTVPSTKTPLHNFNLLLEKERERGLLPKLQWNCPHYIHQPIDRHTPDSQNKLMHSTQLNKAKPPPPVPMVKDILLSVYTYLQ